VDESLLAAARSGDAAALNALVAMHRGGVYRFGLRVCPTTEAAEDAVQETLFVVTRSLPSFRGSASSLASWMFTIVRRKCLRERRATLPLVHDRACETVDPESALALSEALARLDETDREVIMLRDIEELTAPEAAERLSISVDALKSRLHRARARLRAAL